MDDKQFDGTLGSVRPLDVELILQIVKDIKREYKETALYTVYNEGAHVEERGLLQIAPVAEWEWSLRGCDEIPHKATVIVDDVPFFTIFTDEEKQAVLDGS